VLGCEGNHHFSRVEVDPKSYLTQMGKVALPREIMKAR
jgi:hypothetical protein